MGSDRPGAGWPLACLLSLLGAPGGAAAFSSHPQIELRRTFEPAAVRPGQSTAVSLRLEVGAIGAEPLRGVILTEHIPVELGPELLEVLLDGAPAAPLGETAADGAIEPGCLSWRWVLETPPGFAEQRPLGAGSSLEVRYRLSVPPATPAGRIELPGATWLGMQVGLGAAGDVFGHEDGPVGLVVEPAGDDRDGDGLPDDWEAGHGLDPDDPTDAAADPDGDGYSNLDEYAAGTDPTDPGSHPERPNQPPTVTASAEPGSGDAPLRVSLSGAGQDPDGAIVAWRWQFGDGQSADGQRVEHTYVEAGSFVARLSATDDRGAQAEDTVSLVVFEPAGSEPPRVISGGCACSATPPGSRSCLWLAGLAGLAVRRRGRRA